LEAQFWTRSLLDYPAFAKIDLKNFLPFPATYECKVRFSTLLQIKTKPGLGSEWKTIFDVLFVQRPRTKKFAEVKQTRPSRWASF
jgi:hypothetical protein